jgi:hypothetical protein
VPQLSVPPHPSVGAPHWPAPQVFFGHTEQTLPMHEGVAPPQVPQWSVPPHPSEMSPQSLPSWGHVFGVQHALFAHTAVPLHPPQ